MVPRVPMVWLCRRLFVFYRDRGYYHRKYEGCMSGLVIYFIRLLLLGYIAVMRYVSV